MRTKKTICVTINESLLARLDGLARNAGIKRSTLITLLLQNGVNNLQLQTMPAVGNVPVPVGVKGANE